MDEIKLGCRVRDTFTGFEGVATGRSEWLYGCTRISIQPTELKDGKVVEPDWFDVQRVEVIDVGFSLTPQVGLIGGPQSDPSPNFRENS